MNHLNVDSCLIKDGVNATFEESGDNSVCLN